MKIISFTRSPVDWKVNRKVKTTAEDCENPDLQLQTGSFRNLQLYFSLSGSFLLCSDYYFNFTPTLIDNSYGHR